MYVITVVSCSKTQKNLTLSLDVLLHYTHFRRLKCHIVFMYKLKVLRMSSFAISITRVLDTYAHEARPISRFAFPFCVPILFSQLRYSRWTLRVSVHSFLQSSLLMDRSKHAIPFQISIEKHDDFEK